MNEATSMTTEKTLYSKRQTWLSPDLWLLERLGAPPLLSPLDFSPGHPQRRNPAAPCHRPSVDLLLALQTLRLAWVKHILERMETCRGLRWGRAQNMPLLPPTHPSFIFARPAPVCPSSKITSSSHQIASSLPPCPHPPTHSPHWSGPP